MSDSGQCSKSVVDERWFTSLAHARVEIECWRREYNEKRPQKALGGLPSPPFARSNWPARYLQ
jgi:transposase InsO family protein